MARTSEAISDWTNRWSRNPSDDIAVRNGCFFDVSRGAFTVWWIEQYCRLYEGEYAGQHMLLRAGCEHLYKDLELSLPWDEGGEEASIERACRYLDWVEEGNQPDWQYECTMRMFGWSRWSDRWGRNIRRFNSAVIFIPKKQKKALALDTPIPTPSGWTDVQSIKIGDELFDVNGKRCRVIDKTETYVNRECYRVCFSNGESVVCDAGHLWVTSSLNHEIKKTKNGKTVSRFRPFATRTTEEIFKSQRTSQGSCVHSLKMPKPIQCDDASLPIDPYLLGFWLGDGDSDGARVTFAATDEAEVRRVLSEVGTVVREPKNQHGCDTVKRAGIGKKFGQLRTDLRNLGVLFNKHIPQQYLRASIEQRTALLQGLMDTDGHCAAKQSMLIFATSNPLLRENFKELLSSLGIKFSCNHYPEKNYWRFQFMAFADQVACFRFKRKLKEQPVSSSRKWNRSRTVQIVSVEKVDSVPVQCIAIDSPTKEFLFGRTMLPTHNTPSLASWGVYLTCGDGEMGSKCFGGAKDGNQAGIAMDHAIAMIEQSPELSEACKVNRNERSIYHIETRSKYRPLSSANERTRTAKEGINGHILIDETHVVDRDFIKIISRAGISRAEPMRIEVSTAGNNPDGYGKERQDYARLVKSGIEKNDQLFVAIYEAPQDLSDRELDADPVKFGKIANPAWGHTCHEEEYLADYNESKRTISGLADFKMYRLNIWQNTANQWLRPEDWNACLDASWTLNDMAKKRASVGLDLSKTKDMSALSVAVPVGNICYTTSVIFATEDYVQKNADKASLREWQSKEELVVIPGEVIDEEVIWDEFERLSKLLSIGVLVFDKTYAKDFTNRAEKQFGSKLLLIDYPQHNAAMEKPIDDFEAAVINHTIRHNGNRCLTWQAHHAAVIENTRGHRRVVKPKRGDYRKVDAMVASVMAFYGTKHLPKHKTVYSRRGVLTA